MVSSFSVIVLLVGLASAYGLKCYEGFNMSVNGLPLYHWKERDCTERSKCVGQQIGIDVNFNGRKLKSAMRYGACVTDAYADYLDCDTLFGKDSTFDPAKLLDLVPEIEKSIGIFVSSFAKNISAELQVLMSDGTGTDSFVKGFFTFFSNLGFDMKKVEPLQPSLMKMFSALFVSSPNALQQSVTEFFNAFANLDTTNSDYRAAIRSLLKTLNVNLTTAVDNNPMLSAVIDRMPGLVRSVFPSDWKPELWYDVAFKLIANVDASNWTKTAEDMVATIKSSYQIPDDVKTYVVPILDRIPDLVKGSQVNDLYSARWALDLLKYFSSTDEAAKAFSTALINHIQNVTNATLQSEFKETIQWIPGIFYRFFPGDKAVIQKVYTTMADGVNAFNFANLSSTAPETKLSTMIKNLIAKFGGQDVFQQNPYFNALIVNLSWMFRNLMKTTDDYTTYVDKFATVIDDEFKNWPETFNAGRLIGNLVTGMGGTVPPELKPLLDNFQPVITTAMASPFNATNLLNKMSDITDAYKKAFPNSPFPELVHRYIDIMHRLITNTRPEDQLGLDLELQYWNIDLQFAIVKSMDLTQDKLLEMLVKAWPEYGLYIRVMQLMKAEDVKQMMKDIVTWASKPPPHTTEGFVTAVRPSITKITESIKSLMGEIRHMFAPHSCRFGACATDLCNTHGYIAERPVVTKAPARMSTTSASQKTSFSSLFNIATLYMTLKLFS